MIEKTEFQGILYPYRWTDFKYEGKYVPVRVGTTDLLDILLSVDDDESQDLDNTFFCYVKEDELSLSEDKFHKAIEEATGIKEE